MFFFSLLVWGKVLLIHVENIFFCILYIWSIYLNICIYYYKLQYLRPTYFHKILSFSSLTSTHLLSLIISYIATWFNPKDFLVMILQSTMICVFFLCVCDIYLHKTLHGSAFISTPHIYTCTKSYYVLPTS